MLILLVPLGIALLIWVYWHNRHSTLTRNCRWRANRATAPGWYVCVSCGGKMQTDDGAPPRVCVAGQPPDSE
ncbi:hypothetical protein I5535_15200 [Rhodobacteraceae bacterium F11138]|nr:hypothetical protein [Rhodobacteraceae bacterium F11138]